MKLKFYFTFLKLEYNNVLSDIIRALFLYTSDLDKCYLQDILYLVILFDNMALFEALFYVDETKGKIDFKHDIVDISTINKSCFSFIENMHQVVKIAIKTTAYLS